MNTFGRTALILTVLLSVSCTTTKRERTVTSVGPGEATTTETEVTETKADTSCGGALSCTVDFVGDVIAFPFRLVGGAVQGVF